VEPISVSTRQRVFLLDIGDVLINDALAPLFAELAEFGAASASDLSEFYSTQLRYRLWSGDMPEIEFWERVLALAQAPGSPATWRRHLLMLLHPLAAAQRLQEIADAGVVAVVSNHRHEWLRPVLERYELPPYFTRLFISSESGHVKPDASAVAFALAQLQADPAHTTFVDDKEANLARARTLGVHTVLADADGAWVDALLSGD
jgi:HAD superfamily hydrolase (TIGR01509 family)